jgi:prepilin-type N-terminal cleavage/methylation domain-containing protein
MTSLRRRFRLIEDERGFTLVEMLVGLVISMIVLGAVLKVTENFQSISRATTDRNEAEDVARQVVRAVSRNLRNASSPGTSGSGIERNAATDLVFQAVDPLTASGGSNSYSVQRVRYCLDSSNPQYGRLWKQTQTWTTASPPALPATTACPDSAFGTQNAVASWISNASSGGTSRPLFTYDSETLANITNVGLDVYVDVDRTKGVGEIHASSGIFLRNKNREPTAAFSVNAQGNKQVLLNGGASSDPDGQSLTYTWTVDGVPLSNTSAIVLHTLTTTGMHTFGLRVTDSGDLWHEAANQTVDVL